MTPWITAHQASLSITNSQSSLKLMSIESVMPSIHFILCHPLLLLPPIPLSIKVFSQLQIPPRQGKDPPKKDYSQPRKLQLVLWDPVGSKCFSWGLWDFLYLSWRYLSRKKRLIKDGSSLLLQGTGDLFLVCFGVQLLPSCIGSIELSWETLSPET